MIYAVELKYVAMVNADSPEEAIRTATYSARDIVGDSPDPDCRVLEEIDSVSQLKDHGWDGMCLPYGHDGNTRLKDIIKE